MCAMHTLITSVCFSLVILSFVSLIYKAPGNESKMTRGKKEIFPLLHQQWEK